MDPGKADRVSWVDATHKDWDAIAGAAYRVRKPLNISGLLLDDGDVLPANSPLRAMPHRIQQLLERRALEPMVISLKAGARR